jgi:endonuclease YncB( thermonuclease family)
MLGLLGGNLPLRGRLEDLVSSRLNRSFRWAAGRVECIALVVFLLSAAQAALAQETLAGRVVGVTDGDTITVLGSANTRYTIRLAGIDAPEHNQAFGQRSKQNLSRLVFGEKVTLDCGKEESYGRLVCKVMVPNGSEGGRDACLEQVRDGMAWHYKQFQDEQTIGDRQLYAAAEDAAHEARLGLWSDAHPIPPWDFRHGTTSPLLYDTNGHRVASGQVGPVVGNRRSHIYEWPGCPYYDEISPKNRVPFESGQAAAQAGYRPARNCP